MNKHLLSFLSCFLLYTCCWGQNIKVTTSIGNTSVIAGNTVTVTDNAPLGSAFILGSECWNMYRLGFATGQPGNLTFSFGIPVTSIKAVVVAINDNELVHFDVNGAAYTLTAANLINGSCIPANNAAVVGGNLGSNGIDFLCSGEVRIAGNITSVTIANVPNAVGSGVNIALYFFGILAGNNGPVCLGDTFRLYANPDIPGASYLWTGPNGFSSTEQNPVIPDVTAAYAGLYTVKVTTAADTATDTTTATFLPSPIPQVSYTQPVCAGNTLNFSASSNNPQVGYQWSGPNNFSFGTATAFLNNVQDSDAGIYHLMTTLGTCSWQEDIPIEVLHPVADTIRAQVCGESGYDFNGSHVQAAGLYSATFTSSNGCDSISNLILSVFPKPLISIEDSIGGKVCIRDSLLCAAPIGDTYSWYWNNRTLGEGQHKVITLYELTNIIKVIDENNCTDSLTVTSQACCNVFVPNAFSPNGDGRNEQFRPETDGNIKNYQMLLFNRYGQKVYQSYRIEEGWDGMINGVRADVGTYFYYISGICSLDTDFNRKGDFVLLR